MLPITPQRYLEKRRKCNETWCRENPSDQELFVHGGTGEREGQWVTAEAEQLLKKLLPSQRFVKEAVGDAVCL